MLTALQSRIHLCRCALFVLVVVGSAAVHAAPPNRTVLVVGDSLSAEFGLPRDTGWVRRLSERLSKQEAQYSVVNASISGDTTSGGRARLPKLLQDIEPDIVVIELGGNDGLRGLDLGQMRDNLQAMIDASQAAHARVLLVGIRIPPNYGREYTERFFGTFAALAAHNRVALVPFLLDGIADHPDLFQSDRIHPGQEAQERMLDNVWARLRPMLRRPTA